MKCTKCGGKGYYFVSEPWGEADILCEQCHGNGELDENGKPILTNEQYMRSCNTEALTRFLCNNLQQDKRGTLEYRFFKKLYSEYPINPMNAYYEVLKWLKEKHEDS